MDLRVRISRSAWSERVNLSATAFYNDWRNAQIPGPSNTPGYEFRLSATFAASPHPVRNYPDSKSRAAFAALGYTYDDPRFKSGSEDYGGSRFCGVTAGNTTSNFCTLGPSRVLTQGRISCRMSMGMHCSARRNSSGRQR